LPEQSNEIKANGFNMFRANMVKRLTPTHFLVKTEEGRGSFLVEIQEGVWKCDCDQNGDSCEHRFAAQLAAAAVRPDFHARAEQDLKCRYCGSPDVGGCGFRYNAYGISRRYKCNECLRKFSIKFSDSENAGGTPSEMTWLLAEIGMLLTKIEDLIERASLDAVGYARAEDS
jgi:hypothetical protein